MRAEEDIQAKTRKKRRQKGQKRQKRRKRQAETADSRPDGTDRRLNQAAKNSQSTMPNNDTQREKRDTERQENTHKEQHRTTTRADSKGRESQSEAGETLAGKRTEQRQRAGGKKMRDTEAEGEHEKTHTTIEPSRDGGQK